MAIANAELSDNEEEVDDKVANIKTKSYSKKIVHKNIKWEKESDKKYKQFECYSSVVIGESPANKFNYFKPINNSNFQPGFNFVFLRCFFY